MAAETLPFTVPEHSKKFLYVALVQAISEDIIEARKVLSGTHDGLAVSDSSGSLLRVIAVPRGTLVHQATINELESYYTELDDDAKCQYYPSRDSVRAFIDELQLQADAELDSFI